MKLTHTFFLREGRTCNSHHKMRDIVFVNVEWISPNQPKNDPMTPIREEEKTYTTSVVEFWYNQLSTHLSNQYCSYDDQLFFFSNGMWGLRRMILSKIWSGFLNV